MKPVNENFQTTLDGQVVILKSSDLVQIAKSLNSLIDNRSTALRNNIPANFLDSIPKADIDYWKEGDSVYFGLWILESDGQSLYLTHRGEPGHGFSYRYVAPVKRVKTQAVSKWEIETITFEKIFR